MGRNIFSFEAPGLKSLISQLGNVANSIRETVDEEFQASSRQIVREAKRNVPKDTGLLANSIKAVQNDQLQWSISADRNYAPYVEFGTGSLVDIPEGLEDYAAQFKGQGIKQVNLPSRPFLFPAYEAERKNLVQKIKQSIVQQLRGVTVIMPGGSNITSVTTI